MPNWTANKITVVGKKNVSKFKKLLYDSDGVFTFNALITKPIFIELACCLWKGHLQPPQLPQKPKLTDAGFINPMDGYVDYHTSQYILGFCDEYTNDKADWYPWCIDNWGTKWDADSAEVLTDEACEFVIQFDTAWDIPRPVIVELHKKGVEFEWKYAHEGCADSGAIYSEKDESGKLQFNTFESPDGDGRIYEELRGYDPYADEE